MLYIYLTADYELFFGKNLCSENEILINPTKRLLDIARSHGAKVTLMADVLSVFKYREFGLHEYPKAFENQIKYAIQDGHDVQLHIHPHWINSIYSENKWIYDSKNYKIHDLGFDDTLKIKTSANAVLLNGKKYLEDLLKPIDNTYKCIAFRAGGWCIQPEYEVLKALKTIGINIDTTAFYGGYMKTPTLNFDFRKIPNDTSFWVDPNKGLLIEDNNNIEKNIYEVCIGSYSKKPYLLFYKIMNRLSRLIKNDKCVKGYAINYKDNNCVSFKEKVKNKINNFINLPLVLSIEGNSNYVIKKIIKYYISKGTKKDTYISLITHPKNLTDYDFERLDKLLGYICTNYKDVIKFSSFIELNKQIDTKCK